MNIKRRLIRGLVAIAAVFVATPAFADRTTTYYHADGLGSVVAATNEAGQVLWRKDYAPFGEQIDSTPENERTSYTGKQHDDVIGLTYFGARHFDPEIGRFTGIDPVGFLEWNPVSFNRYAYANNNPYRFIDPDGRQSQDASCDEVCEYDQQRQRAASGARLVSRGASNAADVVDREASSAWNWIPFVGPTKRVVRGASAASSLAKPLSNEAKNLLRSQARDIWFNRTGRRAIWDGLQVHHRIPLEWQHLMPGEANRVANLVGMRGADHSLVTNSWNAWRASLGGATPSSTQIMEQAQKVDSQFGHLMSFIR
jgi:RHS repeat-associated protein